MIFMINICAFSAVNFVNYKVEKKCPL